MSSDVNRHMAATMKHQRRYKKKTKDRATKLKLKKEQEEDAAKRLEEVKAIYPQCSKFKYHFKSDIFLERHVCSGIFVPKNALSMAMRYADFSVDGNVASVSGLFPPVEGMPSYATFEANFQGSSPKNHAPRLQQQSRRVHPRLLARGCSEPCKSVGRSSSSTHCRRIHIKKDSIGRASCRGASAWLLSDNWSA